MKTAARELQVHTVCQMILAAIAVGAALYFLRTVLLPFILALFFVTGVAPVLHAIEKKLRAPRMVAVAIAFLLGIILFTMLWLLVWLSVASLLNNAENYRQRIAKLVIIVEDWLPDGLQSTDANSPDRPGPPARTSGAVSQLDEQKGTGDGQKGTAGRGQGTGDEQEGTGVRGQGTGDEQEGTAGRGQRTGDDQEGTAGRGQRTGDDQEGTAGRGQGTGEATPADHPAGEITVADAPLDTTALGDRPIEPLESVSDSPFPGEDTLNGEGPQPDRTPYDFSAFMSQHVGNIMSRLSAALMDLLSSALMVLIFMFFLLLGDTAKAVPKGGVWGQIEAGIRNYIVTKTVISVVTGAAFGIVLAFFGIPLALVFGLLAFFLNFIPNIGPIIASVLPLPLILLHPDLSVFSMVVVIVLTSGIQFVSGNVLEPKIMGDSFDLHPVVILLTLVFWGMLWGIVGMFLATPITAAIKIFLEQFEHTRPIARWLEGRFR